MVSTPAHRVSYKPRPVGRLNRLTQEVGRTVKQLPASERLHGEFSAKRGCARRCQTHRWARRCRGWSLALPGCRRARAWERAYESGLREEGTPPVARGGSHPTIDVNHVATWLRWLRGYVATCSRALRAGETLRNQYRGGLLQVFQAIVSRLQDVLRVLGVAPRSLLTRL